MSCSHIAKTLVLVAATAAAAVSNALRLPTWTRPPSANQRSNVRWLVCSVMEQRAGAQETERPTSHQKEHSKPASAAAMHGTTSLAPLRCTFHPPVPLVSIASSASL